MKIKTKSVMILAVGLCIILAFSLIYITPTAACRRRRHRTFVVRPSSDPDTDTLNIEKAFEKAVKYPGSTVKLYPGHYYLTHQITAVNFDGTFTGSGRDRTFIHSVDAFPLSEDPRFFFTSMFLFYQDGAKNNPCNPLTIRIKDFTILIEGEPEKPEWWPYAGTLNGIDIWGVVGDEWTTEVSYFNTIMERVNFIGEELETAYYGYNGLNAHLFGGYYYGSDENTFLSGYVKGTYIVRDCYFEHFAEAFGCEGQAVNSKMIYECNEFNDCVYGIWNIDAGNSHVRITRNTAVGMRGSAVAIEQGVDYWYDWDSLGLPALEPSKFTICCNDFSGTLEGGDDMIMMLDWGYGMGGPSSLRAYVYCNDIYLDDAGGTAIWGSWLHDAIIFGNTISGTGFMGICLGLWWDKPIYWWGAINADDSSGSKILYNDVSDLECIATGWYPAFGYDPEIDPAARIWLGPLTHGNLVIHFGDDTDVHDVGGMNPVFVF